MAADARDGMDAVTEELYALDPGDFVTARNELVKRLKKAGDKQLAAEVGKLRRPSPAAWAVNQLARRHRSDLEELVGWASCCGPPRTGPLAAPSRASCARPPGPGATLWPA